MKYQHSREGALPTDISDYHFVRVIQDGAPDLHQVGRQDADSHGLGMKPQKQMKIALIDFEGIVLVSSHEL